MKLWIYIFLSTIIWADCSSSQKSNALELWKSAIHEKDDNKKIKLLTEANSYCDYDFIAFDKFLLEAKQELSEDVLQALNVMNNDLVIPKDSMSYIERTEHKWNNKKQIDNLFLAFYKEKLSKEESKKSFNSFERKVLKKRIDRLNSPTISQSFKAVSKIGGAYEADLLFDKNRAKIKNQALVKKIIAVIDKEIKNDSSAFFGLEGGASSGGLVAYNKKLSQARAEALAKEIIKQYPSYKANIKVFVMGESQLVCKGGLLPEKNSAKEYECPTQEDKIRSRRVVIRRVR